MLLSLPLMYNYLWRFGMRWSYPYGAVYSCKHMPSGSDAVIVAKRAAAPTPKQPSSG